MSIFTSGKARVPAVVAAVFACVLAMGLSNVRAEALPSSPQALKAAVQSLAIFSVAPLLSVGVDGRLVEWTHSLSGQVFNARTTFNMAKADCETANKLLNGPAATVGTMVKGVADPAGMAQCFYDGRNYGLVMRVTRPVIALPGTEFQATAAH